MIELLLLAVAGLLAGAWLVGGRVAFGIAVMALSVGVGTLALLVDVPDRDSATSVRRRAG